MEFKDSLKLQEEGNMGVRSNNTTWNSFRWIKKKMIRKESAKLADRRVDIMKDGDEYQPELRRNILLR